jgi:hypothetical protein
MRPLQVGFRRKDTEQQAAMNGLQVLTRVHFGLPLDATVFVAETQCKAQSCSRQTVIAFWRDDGTRIHFRVYRATEEIGVSDLPAAWLADALACYDRSDSVCC